MMRWLALCLALAGCAAQGDNKAPAERDFAVSLTITPVPGHVVQRIDLPATALLGLKRADHGDVRAFDATGRPLAIAAIDTGVTREQRVPAKVMPVAPEAASQAPVEVSVDQGAVTVHAGAAAAAGDPAVLIDARDGTDPVVALAIDADIPAGVPVRFAVSASSDLTQWQPLTEQVLFRPEAGAPILDAGRIALPDGVPHGDWLRVSWHGAAGAKVGAASLITTRTPAPPPVEVATGGLVLNDAHEAAFALPPGLDPAALRVSLTGRDGVVPVQLMGRESAELSWRVLAVGTVRQDAPGVVLRLDAPAPPLLKLVADARGGGFSAAPRLDLLLRPISLLAAFNGAAPYHLALGNAAAAPALLSAGDVAGGEANPPVARVDPGTTRAVIDLAAPASGLPKRTMALWGVLIAGVLVLGLAARSLLRRDQPA